MNFTEQDTQWTAAQLGGLSGDLLLNIALEVYKRGEVPRALALLQEGSKQTPKPSAWIGTSKFRDECIKANDLDTITQLSLVAPNWFPPTATQKMGGLSLAIVSGNKEMVALLRKSGAKPDTLSSYDVGKSNPTLTEKIKAARGWTDSQEDYEWLSAFYWAAVSGDQDTLAWMVETFPDECRLTRDKQKEKKGARGGHQGYTRVVYENVWAGVVSTQERATVQWLFDQPAIQPQIIRLLEPDSGQWNTGRSSHSLLFSSLNLLRKDQEEQVWTHLESPPASYASGTPRAEFAWKNTDRQFRTKLMEYRPDKFLEYMEKYSNTLDHQEWKTALKKGNLEVVKALAKNNPSWLTQTWEDTPAETRRTKRQKGPLLEALLNSTHPDVVEWLAKQPGLLEREKGAIGEYLVRGWGVDSYDNPHRPAGLNSTGLLQWTAQRKQELAASWERLRLKNHVKLPDDSTVAIPSVKAL
jgi:hypothetical protein